MEHTQPRWLVIEFSPQGPRTIHDSTEFEAARSAFASIQSGTWLEAHGRDENGEMIPGVVGTNIFLGRKSRGVKAA